MADAPSFPFVSVIIPCRNDAATLPEVLSALERQTYSHDRYEVLVVDNGSTDGSSALVAKSNARLLVEPVPSAYVARNRAIVSAAGDYLLFLDADTIPCDEWIHEMVASASMGQTGMAGGRIENRIDRDSLGSALLAMTHDPEKRRASVERDGRLSGGNMIVRKELFDRYGLFLPEQSGADGEFSTRANPGRKPMPYAAKAVVTHICDISTMDYFRRAFRIARGQARTTRDGKSIRAPVPWRPGFRRAAEIKQTVVSACGNRFGCFLASRLFLVLWIERWCFFFGATCGRMVKR